MHCKKLFKAAVAVGVCSVMLCGIAGAPISEDLFGGNTVSAAPMINKIMIDPKAAAQDDYEADYQDGLMRPVEGVAVTAGYGGYRGHVGADLTENGIYGREIFAAADGIVMYASYKGRYGNRVVIDHGNGVETLYAHCAQLMVKPGDKVKQGDVIATVGETGNVTGPHLHFELHVNGKTVDPMPYVVGA